MPCPCSIPFSTTVQFLTAQLPFSRNCLTETNLRHSHVNTTLPQPLGCATLYWLRRIYQQQMGANYFNLLENIRIKMLLKKLVSYLPPTSVSHLLAEKTVRRRWSVYISVGRGYSYCRQERYYRYPSKAARSQYRDRGERLIEAYDRWHKQASSRVPTLKTAIEWLPVLDILGWGLGALQKVNLCAVPFLGGSEILTGDLK